MWGFFSRDPTKDFAYDIGERVTGFDDKSLWNLHDGKRKSNGEAVSIFSFDIKNSSEAMVIVAKGAFKRIKTLRHPNMLIYLDGLETDRMLYIVTEAVVPLSVYLESSDPSTSANQLAISWGLHQISKALWFLNNDCSIVHNNVCINSIFVDRAGDWKLGGVDYVYPAAGPESVPPVKLIPSLEKYDPPERSAGAGKRPSEKWSVDAWSLGCLIWEVFNGSFAKNTSLKSPGKIPKALVSNYCELVGANPKSRPSTQQFIESCRSSGGFMDNKFVTTMLFLEEIQIQDQEAKVQFFNGLPAVLDLFPQSVCKMKILPQLINAFEFGSAGSSVLTPLFKLGKLLDGDEYQKKIVPCVVKLFSSTDRATRVKLLQQVEMFCEHLTPAVVNDQIFPNIAHGFMDSNPVVREQTIKSVVHLAPKLNYKNLNEEILKHFARLQSRDDQGGIRTNTTVCLGKIACYLNPQVRQKVLSSAYLRALKDPFPPARQAGVLAMAATHGYFTLAESAQRLLPSLCLLTTDPDKGVRDQAFRAIKCFLGKLEKVSENPELAADAEKDVNSGGTLSGSSAGWANWAVSSMTSLTSKIYKGQGQRGPDGQRTPPAASSPAKTAPLAPGMSAGLKPGGRQASGLTAGAPPTAPSNRGLEERNREPVAEEEEEEEEEGDGWNEDWDDEQKWGDMETSDSQPSTSVAVSRATKTTEKHEPDSSTGDGWDDGGGWDNFDDPEPAAPQPSSKSLSKDSDRKGGTKLASSSLKSATTAAASSFDDAEFEPLHDKSLQPVSSYNWDKTGSAVDPNGDDFFNSLIEDKKKTSTTSILKPSAAKKPSQTEAPAGAGLSRSSQLKAEQPAVSKTIPSKTSASANTKNKSQKKSSDGWDDDSWGDQW